MDPLVGSQSTVSTEAPPTFVADVRGVSRVGSQVPSEFGTGNESFAALGTAIWPLSGMDSLVRIPGRQVAEAFPAHIAKVRLLPCMDSLMLAEIGAVTEALPTLQAAVRLLTRVDPQMFREVRVLLEALATIRAAVATRHLFHVDPLVCD